MNDHGAMKPSWKDSLHQQREALARRLRAPMEAAAASLETAWGDRAHLNARLADQFPAIPYCSALYCLRVDGVQVSDTVDMAGVASGDFGRSRAARPYLKESVPIWGFLLSDAYLGRNGGRPSLTALQVVQREGLVAGYLAANFDLRDLPVTIALYEEPDHWRQAKGDPAIRRTLFQQTRVESPMDRTLTLSLSILEELLTTRGVFQCQIDFSRSLATIWTLDDPYRYRLLDHEALADPNICLLYAPQTYPADAAIPRADIARVLRTLQMLRLTDPTIYLRVASVNVCNGMIGATFSCDGSHHVPYAEFLAKKASFGF